MNRILLITALLVSAGCQDPPDPMPDGEVTVVEAADGFVPLFDGSTLQGWRGIDADAPPEGHWIVKSGTIRKVASTGVPRAADGQVLQGGDLMSTARFRDFDFRFEWKVAPGGNSGIKYNVSEAMSAANDPPQGALGFEYQILDDSLHADGEIASHRTASLYDLLAAPDEKPMRAAGEWNSSRILWRNGQGEHWLNDQMVLDFDIASAAFDSALAASKYAGYDGFADLREGHIVLQDHGDDVWYRNLRIRTSFDDE